MLSALNSQPTFRATSAPAGKPAAAQAEAPQSPIDSLPDLSTIEARVEENAPAAESKEVKTGISGTSKALLAATGLATAAVSLFGAGSAQAQTRYGRGGYGHGHGGYNNGGGYNHRHHRGGGNNTGAIIGGAILGAIIGGAISQQAPPPVYYPPSYPQYPQYPQQQVQTPFYDNYGRLICPNSQGGWYVSTDHYQCRTW